MILIFYYFYTVEVKVYFDSIHVDISLVDSSDKLNIESFLKQRTYSSRCANRQLLFSFLRTKSPLQLLWKQRVYCSLCDDKGLGKLFVKTGRNSYNLSLWIQRKRKEK